MIVNTEADEKKRMEWFAIHGDSGQMYSNASPSRDACMKNKKTTYPT